jgi:hypothetical protein
MDYDNK